MANQAAIALDNSRLYYDINRRREALVEIWTGSNIWYSPARKHNS
jgi:GAF domain-containing protein